MEHLRQLPDKHKKQMIELFRIMADNLETGVFSKKNIN